MTELIENNVGGGILLHLAIIEENLDVVKFLLKHDVPVNERANNKDLAVDFPTDVEHHKHLEFTLDKILREETIEGNNNAIVKQTTTPLHLASRHENPDIAELLLTHGADPNAEMEGGESPLIIAVLLKRDNVIKLLLDNGADANSRTAWGKTALHYATQINQKSIVELLLARGANVDATDLEGYTALHIATEAGYKDIVTVLLDNGANVELKTNNGANVLHFAAVMGHKDLVELILGHGADINAIMKHGGLDLSPFKWITPSEEKKTWELVAKYTAKTRIISWYNTVVMKLYKSTKKSLPQKEAEH